MNVAVLGERNVERFGSYESVVFGDERLTNIDLLDRSGRLATSLVAADVRPGDRVGVMLPNSPAVGVAYGAILRAGAVVVPMLFLLAVPEIHHILVDSEAKAIITSPEFYPNVKAALEGIARPPLVIVTGAAPAEEQVVGFDELVASATETIPIVDRTDDDLAVISYTSGTTGRPKGVTLTHGNMLFNAQNSAKVSNIKDGDVSIGVLPLAHLFGLGNTLVGQLFKITGILLPWFTAEGFFEAVSRHRAVSSSVVPTMLQYMLGHPAFDAVDWSSLRWVVVGAAPLPVEIADEFEKRTGARVLQGYGLTETSPTVSVIRMDDPPKPGSCGRPVPDVEVAILDDDDNPVPNGEPGEVCVKGPNVMAGYYKLPDETSRAMRNGWFHSGDVGHLDEDGFLYITERKKDLIIRGGLNIYPRDVEEVLFTHPAVLEAAVVGVPDDRLGEEVTAFVVLRPGRDATEDELLAFARERLARYKSPKSIRFLDVLPKNQVGKVLKRELRDAARVGNSA
ncbi:MAG: long-chain fatty acid--CoA ligase [Actinomycetota bacterium]